MITRRDVKTPIATFHLPFQQFAVEHVAGHALEFDSGQPAFIAVWPQQRLHAMPLRHQLVNEVRADESGSAGDKSFHNAAGDSDTFL